MMLDMENSMKDFKDAINELFDAKEVLEINVNIFMLKKKIPQAKDFHRRKKTGMIGKLDLRF